MSPDDRGQPEAMSVERARAALQQRQARFPLGQVEELAAAYKFDDPDDVFGVIANAVREQGYFDYERFIKTVSWKSKRRLELAASNDADDVEEVTRLAFSRGDEELRINLMRALRGVNWAMASVLLHVGVDETYPIFDWRALWALRSGMPNSVTFSFWWEYVECCRALAHEAGVSVRELDKALWMYWELEEA